MLQKTKLIIITTWLCVLCSIANSTNEPVQAGQHYNVLPEQFRRTPAVLQLQKQYNQKVQVIMLFSYICHVCDRINIPLDQWQQTLPKGAIYKKQHVVLDDFTERFARIFFSIEKIDPKLNLDQDIFDTLHKKRLKLWVDPALYAYIDKKNINVDTFKQNMTSFEVDHQIKFMKNIEQALNLDYTPVIIVNGPANSYRTDLSQTHSLAMLFKTLDYLVNVELRK